MLKIPMIFLASLSLFACAGRHSSPILIQRGVQQFEREYLVTQEGYGIDNRLKAIFVQGYLEEGMTQEMVNMLWGPPDRTLDDELTWEYVNRDEALISRVKFKESEKARLGEKELVVSVIEGDRYGGSLPPNEKPIEQ
jgi:hypothetical protein